MGMEIMIVLIFLVGLVIEVGVLKLVARWLKFSQLTFLYALLLVIASSLGLAAGELIFGLGGYLPEAVVTIFAVVISYALFHWLLLRRYGSKWKETLKLYAINTIAVVILSLIIVLPVRLFLIEPFYVKGQAMVPTYEDGSYLLIDKFSKDYQRGDVVVFRYPLDKSKYFVKRIIGLPGESIKIIDGQVFINNEALDETDIIKSTSDEYEALLSEKEYYLLGDNRPASLDSRMFGPVTENDIMGAVFYQVN